MSGCAVGPNYHRPVVQTPDAYHDLSNNVEAQAHAASFADLPWWQVFQDPVLQDLIRTALKQNYDLQIATERINAARAQVAITRSALFPQLSGNGNFSGGKQQLFPLTANLLLLTADATFQLDFFGRLRRATQAARAQMLATEEAQHTVTLTLVSDVASAYFLLLQLDLELQITRDTVETQEGSVKLTSLRLDHGVATKLDVLQAQQVLDTANAQIPDLRKTNRAGRRRDQHSSRKLSGGYPARYQAWPTSRIPPEVPAGLPSSLLERRPDIRQAEQTLIAANAEIGVAKASFFPQIALTGSAGGAFGRSSAFSSHDELAVGGLVVWRECEPADFHRRLAHGKPASRRIAAPTSLLAYKQAIQHAFGDVSDALIGYQKVP